MSDLLPPLVMELRAKAGELYSELGKVKTETAKMAKDTDVQTSKMGSAYKGAAGVGKAAILGIAGAAAVVGVASVKMATDYQTLTTQLVTGAGESEENIKMVSDGLLKMAPAVGMGPAALAKAMFTVESAGYHAADGLTVMKAAAEGAKIGGSDATTVANGLTTALTDYHLKATDAATVTSKLVTTVASGKTTMGDLSGALSAVLPSAAAAGVGLDQVLGAMATMTGEGISAQQASQDLAGTIRSLQNPTQQQTSAMTALGLSSLDVAKNLGTKGLTGTLGDLVSAITQHMGPAGTVIEDTFKKSQLAAQDANTELAAMPKSMQGIAKQFQAGTISSSDWRAALKGMTVEQKQMAQQFATTVQSGRGFNDLLKAGGPSAETFSAALSKVTGGSTGMNTALALTGGNLATFQANVKGISGAAVEAGGHVKGWAETQKDFSTQIEQAKAGVEAMGIKLGLVLIPYIQKAIEIGTKWTQWLLQHKPVLLAIAGVVGGVVVTAILAYIASLAVAGVKSVVEFVKMGAAAVTWSAKTLAAIAKTLASWTAYTVKFLAQQTAAAAKWIAESAVSVASWVATQAAGFASAIAAGAVWLAEHTVMVATFVAQNAVMVASAVAAFVAENAATLGIGVALAALVAGIVYVATHWKQVWGEIKDVVTDAWHWIDDMLHNKIVQIILAVVAPITLVALHWKQLWDGAKTALSDAWAFLQPIFEKIKTLGTDYIMVQVDALKTVWNDFWNGIHIVVQTAWDIIQPIVQKISDAVGGISKAIGTVSGALGAVGGGASSVLHHLGFADGGPVPGAAGAPVQATVHGGEYVLSQAMLSGRQPVDPNVAAAISKVNSNGPAKALTGGNTNTVQVNVQTNATPNQIATSVGWELRRMG